MKTILPFFLLILFTLSLAAQEQAASNPRLDSVRALAMEPSFFKSFDERNITEVTLETNMKTIFRRPKKGEQWRPMNFTLKDAAGEEHHYEIEARLRGNSRQRICFYKPLKLKFRKKDLAKAGYTKKYNDFKLVTHCKGGKYGDQNLLKEYLVYKMYRELTEKGFGVQLLKINWIDNTGKRKPETRYGFLIEEMSEMAARLGGTDCDCKVRNTLAMQQSQFNLMSVFQYMIGNTDWWLKNQHNLKIVRPFTGERIYPVPYDFDYSGLVGTTYSVPNEKLPIENVQQRFFMGVSKTEADYQEVLELFKSKKEGIYAVINNCEWLDSKERDIMLKYLDSFYGIIDRPRAVRQQFFLKD